MDHLNSILETIRGLLSVGREVSGSKLLWIRQKLKTLFELNGIYNGSDIENRIVLNSISESCCDFMAGLVRKQDFWAHLYENLNKLVGMNPDHRPDNEAPDWHGDMALPEDLYAISCAFNKLTRH